MLAQAQHRSVNAENVLGESEICHVLLSPLVFQKLISDKTGGENRVTTAVFGIRSCIFVRGKP